MIDDAAKRKLEKALKRNGLVATITVNRRTGNVVGGHQRLAILDRLEGNDVYTMDVSVIDVDERREKELNIVLNNPAAQGSWDVEALGNLLVQDKLDLDNIGFDLVDLEIVFDGTAGFESIFSFDKAPQVVKDTATQIAEIAEMKEARKKHKLKGGLADDIETVAAVVFKTRAERDIFARHFGRGEEDKYVDGHRVAEELGLDLGEVNADGDQEQGGTA